MKEFEEETKREFILCSWTGRVKFVKMSMVAKTIADSVQFLSNRVAFFTELEKAIINLYLNITTTQQRSKCPKPF
jgi:hypothetical protein